ncbi:MAG: aminomethyl-transferring glycine dehydrogenase [Bacteroidetes bacterium]|nr:aminomethyl-transferring glycine dehydrogenase [Bacteroidota bacterium]
MSSSHAPSGFTSRHLGPRDKDVKTMLGKIRASSLDELISQTIPSSIRLKKPLNLPDGMSEFEYLKELKVTASRNKIFKSYIGQGYYNCIIPPVTQRNVLENPGWYTAYTPYQAEISQGRLEALLNFQTMVIDLTGLPIANASLLDEGTAAAEAMILFYNSRPKNSGAKTFFVSEKCFTQTIEVVKTRALPLGIEVKVGDHLSFSPSGAGAFGALIQYPDTNGNVNDYKDFVNKIHSANGFVAVATDLMALTLLIPPGEWGADVVLGNSQRFGVPMGYGGPHAAFFATKEDFKRSLPGRIIGVSVDSSGNPALRMALQTREQHIRREKATSNICTAQALLAIMSSMYGVYHGPAGVKSISEKIHHLACGISEQLEKLGLTLNNKIFFDTVAVAISDKILLQKIRTLAEARQMNFNYSPLGVGVSVDETTTGKDAKEIVEVFAEALGKNISVPSLNGETNKSIIKNSSFARQSSYMTHPVFNTYHSETEMMRYIKRLENKDLSLTHSMISLGSCTMKLNAAAELFPITWSEFANIHPFVPAEQAEGYKIVISELEKFLCEITGFSAVSFQPNSGASGEYAGLLVIQAYHQSKGAAHRKVVLIPSSAHGTNPASAAMAGMEIVIVKCDANGNVDVNDLKEKAEKHKANLSCLMVTYPSTHGVFEEAITEITKTIHDNGGQVYMDGANMNAQVGLTSPATIGADVCHLNLHKTFAIPHGGGGPGVGPIGVAAHLVPHLPTSSPLPTSPVRGGENSPSPMGRAGVGLVSSAPFGSALILLISYGYIKMLGKQGVTDATRYAILNANYMKDILKDHYPILYIGKNGRVAHEMILDCAAIKRASGIEVGDIAKRLMDYGFHAPTVAFPVHDTLMVEPAESESKEELDKFCDAMISIRKEIQEVAAAVGSGSQQQIADNVLKNAPHTAKVLIADDWKHSYPREKAAYPLKWVRENKFWPSVGRVDNAHGDRNLICACPPVESYAEADAKV